MNTQVIVGAFLSSLLSGFVPLVNGEVVAVTATLLAGPDARIPLLLACVGGQMFAKFCLYGLARWSPQRLPLRARNAIVKAREQWKSRRGAAVLVFVSAGMGVPPFYLTTLAAGALRVSLLLFAVAGVVGTLTRYVVIVWGATRFAQ